MISLASRVSKLGDVRLTNGSRSLWAQCQIAGKEANDPI